MVRQIRGVVSVDQGMQILCSYDNGQTWNVLDDPSNEIQPEDRSRLRRWSMRQRVRAARVWERITDTLHTARYGLPPEGYDW